MSLRRPRANQSLQALALPELPLTSRLLGGVIEGAVEDGASLDAVTDLTLGLVRWATTWHT